jgi:hypothetical protein
MLVSALMLVVLLLVVLVPLLVLLLVLLMLLLPRAQLAMLQLAFVAACLPCFLAALRSPRSCEGSFTTHQSAECPWQASVKERRRGAAAAFPDVSLTFWDVAD